MNPQLEALFLICLKMNNNSKSLSLSGFNFCSVSDKNLYPNEDVDYLINMIRHN